MAAATSAAGQFFSNGVAERVWGEALAHRGDHVAADRHMEASIRALGRGGIAVQIARTEFRWALQRRRRGEIDAAAASYETARADVARFGCVYAREECERLWNAEPSSRRAGA